ncbi:MAG: glycosyltransferase family 9 protein [Bacteroidetes bacterium]|nr:glycosyltransferase family 9 protein [Bacteroidota bacterium]
MRKILIIQTAFPGDVILATGIAEKLHIRYPDAATDFIVRQGNEGLLQNHPFIRTVYTWQKKEKKYGSLLRISRQIRKERYDAVINVHRFASSGFLTWRSGAKIKAGFGKNPFSFCFTHKAEHHIGIGKHETERNHDLIKFLTDDTPSKPKLYPSDNDYKKTAKYKSAPYICIAPASVWFTKQYPAAKWAEVIRQAGNEYRIYMIGSHEDIAVCNEIINLCRGFQAESLAGSLSFLESAALMRDAVMNFVNDSAPLHIASAMNAQVTAIFCSTVPDFGFGPLSEISSVAEVQEQLDCRPCGLHGKEKCPEGHFRCAYGISAKDVLSLLRNTIQP